MVTRAAIAEPLAFLYLRGSGSHGAAVQGDVPSAFQLCRCLDISLKAPLVYNENSNF